MGILVFLMLLTPLGLSAQQTDAPQAYTLEESVSTALENNPSIAQGKYQIDVQEALKRTATDIGKTEISYQRGQYNSVNPNDNSLTISQRIPFPTVFSSRAALGKAQVEGSERQLAVTKNELVREVKLTWYQLAYLQAYQEVLQRQDSLFENFLRAANVRYRTGEARLLEKTTAESESMALKNRLEQNQADVGIYQSRLQALLNVPEQVSISAGEYARNPAEINLDSAQMASNPALRYWQQQVNVAEKRKSVEAANLLPDFTVGYFNQTLIGFQNTDGQEQYYGPGDRFSGFQVGIAIPLWFAPQTAKIRAAKLNSKVAEKTLDRYQLNLRADYDAAIKEYLKNSRSLAYYEESALPNAELILNQSQTAFSAGEINYVEFLQGVRTAVNTRTTYLEVLNNYNQSIINIEFILGNN